MENMPKIQSPFVRREIEGNYIVTPEISEGFEWVFEDDNVLAVEKLDGTNVSIYMNEGKLCGIMNRTQTIHFDVLVKNRFIDGIRTTYEKGRIPLSNGQHFGELMGPKIQKNFLKLEEPEWFPFDYLKRHFHYKSWGKYPKDFNTISNWFKNDLFSLMYVKLHNEKIQPEGIVFHHIDGRMAKLRGDMFDWYKGRRHKEEE